MKDLLAKAKDLLEKAKGLVAKGVAWFRGMDRTKKILVISSAAVVAVVIVAVCVVAALPGGDAPTEPTTTGPVSMQTVYQVCVKDASGKPYTAGVIVKFMRNGQQVAMQPVNGNGVAEKALPNGEYTIELEFTNAANAASYDQKNAVVDTNNPRLELVLMNTISGETVPLFATSPVTGEGREYQAYHVSTGDTSVPLEKGERSFFLFAPTEAGTYRFTTSNSNAVIGYYGAPHFVLPSSAAETVANAFEISVTQDMIGTNGTGTAVLVIGIDSVGDVAACTLTIERVGDPAWDISQEPWTQYQNVFTPVPFVMGEDASIQEFDLTASTDTYNLVFNAADGCYHMDSEDGPLVLIRLAEKSAYTESYQKMLETTGINAYFFDDDGKFIKKEDYSGNVMAYLECVDEATGMYPLTEDLKYILQNNGEHLGWWSEGGYYLFLDADGNKIPGINTEIAWLFMCCYDENSAGSFVEDTTQPETTEPETTVPETTEQETTVPPTTIPPVATTPVETQPVATRPTAPAVTQPVETKPVATRPADTRPAATRPVVTRPVETVPTTTVPPTTLAPTTVPPTTVAPTTVPPTTATPTTVPPMTAAPTTVPPTTVAPTTVPPTTVAPTTVPPTTVAPTTVPPTTAAPTTVPPTTVAPTTVPPTTAAPTTVPPTTVPPTTLPPTTVAPTTVPPTTVPPTTLPPTTAAPTEPKPALGELVDADDPWLVLLGDPPVGNTETVAAGTYKKFNIPRLIGKFYVTIQDADAYIVYGGETYYPTAGILTVEINSRTTQGVEIGIGNAGSTDKAFRIAVSRDQGSDANPFTLQLGNITTNVEEGNDKGVYYVWTPSAAGKLTVKLTDWTGADDAGITVSVIDGDISVLHMISSKDEIYLVEVDVMLGNQIKIEIYSESDNFNHPETTVYWEASFE